MSTEHFKDEEFECHDGCGLKAINQFFLKRLEAARQLAGISFEISSGCRCVPWNEHEGGEPFSAHLLCSDGTTHAADIRCRYSRERFIIIRSLLEAGFTRIGIAGTFIHVDDDRFKVRDLIWTYPKGTVRT